MWNTLCSHPTVFDPFFVIAIEVFPNKFAIIDGAHRTLIQLVYGKVPILALPLIQWEAWMFEKIALGNNEKGRIATQLTFVAKIKQILKLKSKSGAKFAFDDAKLKLCW
jgi:hypothetical protein